MCKRYRESVGKLTVMRFKALILGLVKKEKSFLLVRHESVGIFRGSDGCTIELQIPGSFPRVTHRGGRVWGGSGSAE